MQTASVITSLGTQSENLAMGGFKVTDLAAGTAAADAVRYDQIGDVVRAGTSTLLSGETTVEVVDSNLTATSSVVVTFNEDYTPATRFWTNGPYVEYYYRTITISNTYVDSTLTNFPVLVKLTSGNFDFSHALSDGSDVSFWSGATQLKHEIEYWNQVGEEAYVWVKVPSVSSSASTTFQMRYTGRSTTSGGEDPTNVWDSGFKLVMHASETSGTTLADSTANGNDFTKKGATEPNPTTGGQIDGAQEFDETNDYASRANDADFNLGNPATHLCVEFMIKGAAQAAASFVWYNNGSPGNDYWVISYTASPFNKLRLYMKDSGSTIGQVTQSTASLDGSFHHVALVYDATAHNVKIYMDGALDCTPVSVTFARMDMTSAHVLGASDTSGSDPLGAILDELRISVGTLREAAWIKASYRSNTDGLLTVGSESTTGNYLFVLNTDAAVTSDSDFTYLIDG